MPERSKSKRGSKRKNPETEASPPNPDPVFAAPSLPRKVVTPKISSSQQQQQPDSTQPEDDDLPDVGQELIIPDDPLQEYHLPDNFFVPKEEKNLGVGKLGEPRLIIHHIENENFKSYAGKVILGPFHQNFTSIIGPNGSGKSNVIDSMLFVFAFSAKRIRLSNLAGLIHNSDSVKHNRPTSATVTIHFETVIDDVNFPGEKFTKVPNSEFTISRTCFKDGGSVYWGKVVVFDKILWLFSIFLIFAEDGLPNFYTKFIFTDENKSLLLKILLNL